MYFFRSKRYLTKTLASIVLIFLVICASCSKYSQNTAEQKLNVVVSILPEKFFVEKIAQDKVGVTVLVDAGQNPHNYEASPRQMAEISQSVAWFTIGADFEKAFVSKISSLCPNLKLVDCTKDVIFRKLVEAHNHEESHSATNNFEQDIHIWLGHSQSKTICKNIKNYLCNLDPQNSNFYSQNYDKFAKEIDESFFTLKQELSMLEGTKVFVYHPSFGYFFDEFGIVQEAVETGGKEPNQQDLAALIKEANNDGAKVLFVQAQFPVEAAKTVAAAIGGKVVSIDPLAENWTENLFVIGKALIR